MRFWKYSLIVIVFVLASIILLNGEGPWVHARPSGGSPSGAQKITVLMYHDIAGETSKSTPAAVSVTQFKEHLKAVRDNDFHFLTMDEFQKFMQGRTPVPDSSVLITFDDGYESFYKHAFPLLKELGVTASVFVIGASTDMFNPDALPHMTWDEMREMKDAGMGFYNHTYHSHDYVRASKDGKLRPALAGPVYLTNKKRMETGDEFRKRVRGDLSFMEKRLSVELGEEAQGLLAIPYGIYDKAVVEEGRKAGISLFFTTKEGTNTPGHEEIFRVNAGKPDFSGEQLIEQIRQLQNKH